MTNFLVIDVGTTGLRASVVDDQLRIVAMEFRANAPVTPVPGLVEFDAVEMAALTLQAAHAVLATLERDGGEPVSAVGIATQRGSVVVWDRATGEPIAPGIGWQDLRTIMECITAKAEHGWAIAPNQSVTKAASILANTPGTADRDLCIGTVDSWIAWTLTDGAVHVSDQTNTSATTSGMREIDGSGWRSDVLDAFAIPVGTLPAIVDSAGVIGAATALPGSPPIASMLGDQQASLIGQACVRPGRAKMTFGTGGMLDLCTDAPAPALAERNVHGTYPLALWARGGRLTWGIEGILLSAGTNVEWLRDDLGLIDTSEQSHLVASQVATTEGVVYVPALLGLGTPKWDYGARGTLLGLTRGTNRHHVVRAVLEGVAQRGADMVEAAVADSGLAIDTVRVDGGMSRNPTFIQSLANATGRTIEVSPVVESTTIGAAFMAGVGIGIWTDLDEVDALWNAAHVVRPDPAVDRDAQRLTWSNALERSEQWHPELSALDF